MTIMSWLAIIAWMIANLPAFIAFIKRLFSRTKTMKFAESEDLRLELSNIIQSKKFTRKEKRLLVQQILLREESKHVALQVAAIFGG